MRGDQVLINRSTADQVFLDDLFQHLRGAVAIPGAFRINHGHRSVHAELQAIDFAAVNPALFYQVELYKAALKIFPRFKAGFAGRALWLALIAAQQNVALHGMDAEPLGLLAQGGLVCVSNFLVHATTIPFQAICGGLRARSVVSVHSGPALYWLASKRVNPLRLSSSAYPDVFNMRWMAGWRQRSQR